MAQVTGMCKVCKTPIVWIKTPKGKNMPCDAEPVGYEKIQGGSKRIVTPNGDVIACEYPVVTDRITGVGYVPHWATCPAANSFRKIRVPNYQ